MLFKHNLFKPISLYFFRLNGFFIFLIFSFNNFLMLFFKRLIFKFLFWCNLNFEKKFFSSFTSYVLTVLFFNFFIYLSISFSFTTESSKTFNYNNPFVECKISKNNFIQFYHDRIDKEYILLCKTGIFEYVVFSKNKIYDYHFGTLPINVTKIIFSKLNNLEIFDLDNLYLLADTNEIIHEIDRITLTIRYDEKEKNIIADTAVQPQVLSDFIRILHSKIDNYGDIKSGNFIKCKELNETVTTSNGKMTLGQYMEYKGKIFHDPNIFKEILPEIIMASNNINRFFQINKNDIEKLTIFFDSKSRKEKIYLKSDASFLVLEIFSTERR